MTYDEILEAFFKAQDLKLEAFRLDTEALVEYQKKPYRCTECHKKISFDDWRFIFVNKVRSLCKRCCARLLDAENKPINTERVISDGWFKRMYKKICG